MTRANKYLLVILVLQVGILAASRMVSTGGKSTKPHQLFQKLKTDEVTRIKIQEKDKTVLLDKSGDKWVLASGGGYPVEQDKVTDFLARWPGLTVDIPVATKPEHQRALEVVEESYQRKVTLTQTGKKPITFYLGTSTGPRDVHLRFEGDQPVYLIKGVSAWDVGTAARDWVKTEYFKLDKDQVVTLRLRNAAGEIQLDKGIDGVWGLAGIKADGKLSSSAVDALVSAASSINLQDPVSSKLEPIFGLESPSALLTVVTQVKVASPDAGAAAAPDAGATGFARATHVIRFGAAKDDAIYAKSNDSSFVVRVSTYTAETFTKKKAEDLLEKEKKEEKPGMGGPGAGMGGMPGMGLPGQG